LRAVGKRVGALRLIAAAGVLGAAFSLSNQATAQRAPRAAKEPAVRYSHTDHEKHGVKQKDCSKCHQLDEEWTVQAPTRGRDHQPCNESGCHAKEYFSREPKICVVCHADSRPWVKQKAELKRRKVSEFGGDLSHKTHATARVGGRGANGPCLACHGDPYRDEPTSGGHADCAPCHGSREQPRMGDCGDCHRLGARKARVKAKGGPWRVAALFTHTTHGRDPRRPQTQTECTTCHAGVTKATRLADIKNPTMRSCDTCHDGEAAFKTTGFECYRCHSESK
jgi:c(7)-type cytochrome triheme protein